MPASLQQGGAHLAHSIHRLSGIPLQVRVGHAYPQDEEANQKAASFRASPEITEHPHSPQHKLMELRSFGRLGGGRAPEAKSQQGEF